MSNEASATRALALLARIELDASTSAQIAALFKDIIHWDSFVARAEANGLAPLVNNHLRDNPELSVALPKTADLQLKALTIRHQRTTQVRAKAITEIAAAYQKQQIEFIALKGLALAYSIYPAPALRPMRDIDLLVPKAQAQMAQQALRDIGYAAADRKEGALYDHHHLPIASKSIDDMTMSLEVHHDALSGDVASSISYANLNAAPIAFDIEGQNILRLGHVDTLRHLCHHSFEPAARIKLGSLLDFALYAQTYREAIDWNALAKNHAYVLNALRCVHFVTPLSDALAAIVQAPQCIAPARAGEGYLPLSTLLAKRLGKTATLRQMLDAPAWWAHVFYGVAPENSLVWVKWWRHPLQVTKWIMRRYWAMLRARLK